MFPRVRKKRIYLDYAAATPVRREVLDVMQPFWHASSANPSAIHTEGVQARQAIEKAREKVARVLHVRTPGVLFTGSGTESNNLALLGTVAKRREEGVDYSEMEIVSTAIEHPSIMQTLMHLEVCGVNIRTVATDADGVIDSMNFKSLLSDKTILVTFAYANSEIGTVQSVSKLARIVRAYEKERSTHIYVHLDAAQAPLWLPCALDKLSVDLLSLDAGKCYGPKGVGVLAMRHGVVISSHMFGGGQERGLRPGTENTPLIVGAAEAIEIAQEDFKKRSIQVKEKRDACMEELLKIEGVTINGSLTQRLANNINISIPGIDTEFAVISLDEKGIACSTKSACSGTGDDGSFVVLSISGDVARAASTIRFSLGEETTLNEIQQTADVLSAHIKKVRKSC